MKKFIYVMYADSPIQDDNGYIIMDETNKTVKYRGLLLHRCDGPAFVTPHLEVWAYEGRDITDLVKKWSNKNAIPHYTEWTITEKKVFNKKLQKFASKIAA